MSCGSCDGYESNKCPDCERDPDFDDAVISIADVLRGHSASAIEDWISNEEGEDVDAVETEFSEALMEEGLSDFEDEIRHRVQGEF